MLYESKEIMNMDDNTLLKLITKSKYPGYRLGDVVLNYPCHRRIQIKKCYTPQKKQFPDSLAIEYTTLYKDTTSLGLKIGQNEKTKGNESIKEPLTILMNLCDNLNLQSRPDEDALVATIRLGDMIQQNKEKKNSADLIKSGGTFYTPAGGARHVLSADDIVKNARKKGLTKIILVGSKAIGTGMFSVKYLKQMIDFLTQEGFCVQWFYSESPDEDLAFISHGQHILSGPGGFCLVANAISVIRHNKDEKILPIKKAVNFFG